MERIFTEETIKNVPERDTNEIINKFLNSDHGLTRSMSAIQIALKSNNDYKKHSEILLDEMNKNIHFLGVRFGIKSAWTIAIALIECLKKEDYFKVKNEFDKWSEDKKKGLLAWLKDYPDHSKILINGKI